MKNLIKTLTTILILSTSFVYSQSYTCPTGWTLDGNECVHRVAPTAVTTYTWSCSGSDATDTRLAGISVDDCSTVKQQAQIKECRFDGGFNS